MHFSNFGVNSSGPIGPRFWTGLKEFDRPVFARCDYPIPFIPEFRRHDTDSTCMAKTAAKTQKNDNNKNKNNHHDDEDKVEINLVAVPPDLFRSLVGVSVSVFATEECLFQASVVFSDTV